MLYILKFDMCFYQFGWLRIEDYPYWLSFQNLSAICISCIQKGEEVPP